MTGFSGPVQGIIRSKEEKQSRIEIRVSGSEENIQELCLLPTPFIPLFWQKRKMPTNFDPLNDFPLSF
jgi:hypothetical protein